MTIQVVHYWLRKTFVGKDISLFSIYLEWDGGIRIMF